MVSQSINNQETQQLPHLKEGKEDTCQHLSQTNPLSQNCQEESFVLLLSGGHGWIYSMEDREPVFLSQCHGLFSLAKSPLSGNQALLLIPICWIQ